ncbi:serine/threonine-protein kinase [Nocardia concava]|uniref:serine/threonine-protein kinase n=1 Tax=Nocardia concava TaxID=257281 RepID=UPI0003103558|nr:serine/threonine-protein kinase [Nocardia concava]
MADADPEETQAAANPAIVEEFDAAGFEDATIVGRGGFGVVYRCRQRALGRIVAVKVLSSDLDPENRERFLREGYAMGGLSGHPNIVNILEVGVTRNGRPFIVMQYHRRDSLAARLRREGPLPWPEVISIGVKLSGALETAHRAGTLHRDIKPANILLTDYGEPQLTDFGIAHIAGGYETATGGFTGSFAYTAPEVIAGDPPTPRSDVYGLGAALFALISGRAAFERKSGEEIAAQFLRIGTQPIPDLRSQGIPDNVCSAIERAMAVDPTQRQPSAAELGRELQAAQRANGLPVDRMALTVEIEENSESPRQHRPESPVGQPIPGHWDSGYPDRNTPREQRHVSLPGQIHPQPRPFGPPLPPVSGPPLPPTSEPQRRTSGKRRRRMTWIALIAVILVAVVATGGYLLSRQTDTGNRTPGRAGAPTVDAAAAWRPLTDAPTARQQTASTMADGTIWIFGGLDNDGASARQEGYDPAIDTWKAGPDLPIAVNHPMAVTYNDEPVVLGGWVASGGKLDATASDRVMAMRAGKWVELPHLIRPRAAGAAAVVGNKIVVTGGQADNALVPTTEVFDGTSWTTVADLPTPRDHLAAVSDGKYVYAIGGRNLSPDKNFAACERFDPATGTWTRLPDMPTPRGGLGATFVDGRIVAVGGEEPTRVLSAVEAYDVAAGTWSQLPALRTPRHGLAVAAVGNTVYAIDGAARPTRAESSATNEALRLAPRKTQPAVAWRTVVDAPIARQQSAATTVDGTIWVFGGLDKDGLATGKVAGYDPAIDTWKSAPDLPIPLNHAMAVAYRGELVVLGGGVPEGATSNMIARPSDRVLVLRNGKWVDLPPLHEPRAAGAAAVVGDKIVVTGGLANGKLLRSTEVFDGTRWITAADIPTPRDHLAAVSDGTYFFAVGGRNITSDKNFATFERFDPATGTWTKLPDMPTPRGGLGATLIDGRIVAVGGEAPTQVLDVVEAFDIAAGTWSQLPTLPTGRHGLTVLAVGHTVYAIGGALRPTHTGSTAISQALDFL